MADISQREIQDAVRDGTQEGLAGLSDKLSQAITAGLDKLGSTLGVNLQALKNLPQVATGVATSGDANKAFETTVTIASKALGEKLGGILSTIAGVLIDIRNDSRAMGSIGVGQGNVPGMRYEAQQAGYANVNDAIKHLAEQDKSIKGGGKSMDEAAKNFMDFAKEMRSNPEIINLLKRGIIRDEDIPRIAAIAAGGKTSQLSDPAQRAKLAQDTVALADSIEKQVKAYGLNRDALYQNSQALNNSAEEQLKMQALRSDAERQNVKEMQTNAAAQGESIQKIISSLAAGQRLTREQQLTLQMATGGRGGQFRSAVREMQRTANLAADDPLRIAARNRYDRELANMNSAQNRRRFAQIGMNTTDPDLRNAALNLQRENQAKASQGATQQQYPNLTPAEAKQLQMNIAQQNMLGYTQDSALRKPGEKPTPNAEAESLKLISEIYISARTNAVAATGAFADLNKELGKSPEKLKPIRDFFEFLFGKTEDTADKKKKEVMDPTVDMFKQIIQSKLPTNQRGENNPLRQGLQVNAPGGNITISNPTSVNVAAPNSSGPPPNPLANPLRETRGKGTLGETGAPLEAKDVVAQLHKGETVLNPAQLSNLINGVTNTALGNVSTTVSSINKTTDKKSEIDIKPVKVDLGAIGAGADVSKQIPRKASDPIADLGKMFERMIAEMKPSAKLETPTLKLPDEFGSTKAKLNDEEPISFPKIKDAFADFKPETEESIELPKEPELRPEAPIAEGKVELKDLHDELIQLNTHIKQLIEHSADISESANRQIRATEKSSSNRFA